MARRWTVRADTPGLDRTAQVLRELLAPHLAGLAPSPEAETAEAEAAGAKTVGAAEAPGVIRLVLGDVPLRADALGVAPTGESCPDESYRVEADEFGLFCLARTPVGVFRAAVSALHLLTAAAADGADTLPCGSIDDGPRYAWRGLMLDPARSFLSPDELRRVVDLAALYKLNVLHLHLTDNEGWRLEIASRPGLTADAAQPYYSAAEYRALQTYAAERHVVIVPEIDLPGHSAAAPRAYPGLGTLPRPSSLPEGAPFTPPLDAHDPGTRAFLVDVLTEVARLTEGPYLHFGGDEAVGADADAFTEAVTLARDVIRRAGKRPVGWQESSRAGIGSGDIAQFWVDVAMMELPETEQELHARPELVDAGYTLRTCDLLRRFFAPTDGDLARIVAGGGRVLLSPQSHLYLDRPYDAAVVPPEQAERARRLGFAYRPRSVAHTAGFDPAAYGLRPENVAGIEATLFGETLCCFEDLTTLLLPRLAGVAEAAWTGAAPSWDEYRGRLALHSRLWRERGLTWLPTTEVDWR
ncbi:family 20 glycosylhydrolase [Streptacidiphilus sp. NEAU-YB345]|uniref:beta-N-acetylhexosaminidase n=1 Tax=Streptacidiphilus fuscans TaxID=2789292 RepID=A0A931AZS7_9ACTN|nr:family 20 glycosylhydrolase [Streptacidiphilus fuscans]